MDIQSEQIKQKIPQRDPFLFVDQVIEQSHDSIITEKTFPFYQDFFSGHFPENPVVPGVILCEAVFQTAGIYLSGRDFGTFNIERSTSVVTRIKNAKFKKMVGPDETLRIHVQFVDQVSNMFTLKGKIFSGEEIALTIDFSVALVESTGSGLLKN